jgi:hypothetical protein
MLPLPVSKRKPIVKLNGKTVKSETANDRLVLTIDAALSEQWLTVEL